MVRASRIALLLLLVPCVPAKAQTDRENAEKLMASAQAVALEKTPDAYHKAVAQYEQAAASWRKAGEAGKQIEALYGAATMRFFLREFTEESALLTSAMDLAREANIPAARADILAGFGFLHNQQGEHRKAIAEFAEAREIYHGLNNTAAVAVETGFEATSWVMLGNAAEQTQDTAGAADAFRQAAGLFQEAGDSKQAGQQYVHLGLLDQRIGTPASLEQAAGFFTTAIPFLEAASARPDLVSALWSLGTVTALIGQTERSRDALLKALPNLSDLPNQQAQAMLLDWLADAFDKLNDHAQAVVYYERTLTLLASIEDPLRKYVVHMKSGKAHEALDQKAEALAAYQAAAAAAHAAGDGANEATAQGAIGRMHAAAHRWQSALEALGAAQKLHAGLGDKPEEAGDWGMMGAVYASQGHYREKLAAIEHSLALLKGRGDRQAETQALIDAGDCYNALHLSQPAIENLEKARALADNDTQKAAVLVELGEVYYGLSKLDQALELENQALAIVLKLDEPAFAMKVRNDLGLTKQARGEMSEARKIFDEGLADAQKRHDVQQTYTQLHNLGQLHQDLGDSQESVRLFEEALAVAQRDGESSEAATTLESLGTAYHLIGQDDKALATLRESLSEWRTLDNQNGESIALNNLALVYNDIGRPQQAIDAMNEALSKKRGLGDDAGVADLQRALGGIYQGLGDYDRAESYLHQALDTQKKFGDEHGQALTHNGLGVIQMSRHDRQASAALDEFNQALPLIEKFGDRRGEATVRSNMANALLDTGELKGAEERFHQSLAIAKEINDVNGQALALHGLGSVYERSGDFDRALDNYRQALGMWRELHEPVAESKAHSLIAKVERKQGKIDAALAEIGESIRLLESQRGGLASEDLRAYFLAAIADPWKVRIDLLMDMHRAHPGQGWDARALEASERARARSLLDLLASSRIDLQKGVDPKLTAADRKARQSLAAKAIELPKVKRDSADYKQLQLEVAELTAERERIEAAMRAANPRYASLAAPEPLTLRQIQTQVLDRQTMLLEYSLGEERSYLFAVTGGALSTYELPKREDVENAATDLDLDLQHYEDYRDGMRKKAAALSAMLLGPVASEIKGNRLLIAGDGELARVPFAALPNPSTGQPLILTNEILTQPSASMVAILRGQTGRRKEAAKEIAVIADPVFEATDARMRGTAKASATTSGGNGFTRLDHSDAEAHAILAQAPAGRSLSMLGFQANKTAVMDGRLADYRIVHFATHGQIDLAHPQLSGLALSFYDEKGQPEDGFLDLNAIFDMKLQADLVVLSACQSGEGKPVGGEGLMGLTRGFFYAGAASMAVSFWTVDDEATGELMKRFYQGMLGKSRLRPAAALRAAQRSMILDSRWPDPYYWAAFTIEGEWR